MKATLLRDYYFYGGFILIIAVTSSLWSAWKLYTAEQEAIETQLLIQTQLIDSEIDNYFKYVSHIAEDKGHKIALRGESDLKNIAHIFNRAFFFPITEDGLKDKTFRWPHFSWINKDSNLLVTSESGILSQPVKVDSEQHLYQSSVDHWVLHLSDPVLVDDEAFINGSLGVASLDSEEYIGTISTQFSVDELIKAVKSRLEGDIEFILLNEDLNIVVKSYNEKHTQIANPFFANYLQGITLSGKTQLIPNEISYENYTYKTLKKSSNYPFVIVTGYNPNMASTFLSSLLKRSGEVFGAAFFLLAILIIQRRRMIKPIQHLADVAKRIAQGVEDVEIREHKKTDKRQKKYPIEIHKLREAVLYTKIFMTQERKSRARAESSEQKLEEFNKELKRKNEAAKKSRKLLDKYLHEIRRGTVEETIIKMSQDITLLREREKGSLDMLEHDAMEIINKQLERCARILAYTSDELELVYVDIEKLIDECVALQRHVADMGNVDLIPDITVNKPEIYIDKRGMKQVITSLIYYLIEDRKRDKPSYVKISAKTRTRRKKKVLEIIFEGNGLGVNEELRLEFEKNREQQGEHTNSTSLNLFIIKHIISMHNGTYKADTSISEGTTVTVTIPYRTPKMIESENSAKKPESTEDKKPTPDKKIIKLFPKRDS